MDRLYNNHAWWYAEAKININLVYISSHLYLSHPFTRKPPKMSEIRQRNPLTPKSESSKPKPTLSQTAKAEDNSFSLLDALRGLCFILLLSSAISYFVTRDSFVWNVSRPKWTRVDVIKTWIVCFPSLHFPLLYQLKIKPRTSSTLLSRPNSTVYI